MEHCTDCSKPTRDEFKKEILNDQKRSRYDLVFLMLNILHHIQPSGGYYYYCEKIKHKCRMCAIPMIFCNFEKDIDKNMFHLSLLIHTIQSSALGLCNIMMRKKPVSIPFFTSSVLLVGETGQQEKPLLESIRYSKSINRVSSVQINCLSLLIKV